MLSSLALIWPTGLLLYSRSKHRITGYGVLGNWLSIWKDDIWKENFCWSRLWSRSILVFLAHAKSNSYKRRGSQSEFKLLMVWKPFCIQPKSLSSWNLDGVLTCISTYYVSNHSKPKSGVIISDTQIKCNFLCLARIVFLGLSLCNLFSLGFHWGLWALFFIMWMKWAALVTHMIFIYNLKAKVRHAC